MGDNHDDFDIIKSWLEKDLEDIELPQSLKSENLMHLIQGLPEENTDEPEIRDTPKQAKVIPLRFTPLKLATYAASFAIVLLGISQIDRFGVDLGTAETAESIADYSSIMEHAVNEESIEETEGGYASFDTSSSEMQKAMPRSVANDEVMEDAPMQIKSFGVQHEDDSVAYEAGENEPFIMSSPNQMDANESVDTSSADEPEGITSYDSISSDSDGGTQEESEITLPLELDPSNLNPATGVDFTF